MKGVTELFSLNGGNTIRNGRRRREKIGMGGPS
jgi:hypothetical protein